MRREKVPQETSKERVAASETTEPLAGTLQRNRPHPQNPAVNIKKKKKIVRGW